MVDLDDDYMPSNRVGVQCMNCGYKWHDHDGWLCYKPHPNNSTTRSSLPQNMRYLTPDMLEGKPTQPTLSEDVAQSDPPQSFSHWKAWAHNQPGDCPCGIKRDMCTYHK